MIPTFTVVYTNHDAIIIKSYPMLINALQGLYLKEEELPITQEEIKKVLLTKGVIDLYDYGGEYTPRTIGWYVKVKLHK